MPPSADTLATQQLASPGVGSSSKQLSMMYVPMDNAAYETEGICLTGPTQLSWISQLVQRPRNFVLHADGKHKLHHGKWVLMTVGTHYLRYDVQNQALCTTFAPLPTAPRPSPPCCLRWRQCRPGRQQPASNISRAATIPYPPLSQIQRRARGSVKSGRVLA